VSVIEADVPQVLPSERVEAVALDLARKDRGREADLTLEDAREGLLLERLRSAEVNSSGNKIFCLTPLYFRAFKTIEVIRINRPNTKILKVHIIFGCSPFSIPKLLKINKQRVCNN
jgi:hypothetical protein